jgi:hypothetical protein
VRVSDEAVTELHERGFVVVEGFLTAGEVEAAREGLWAEFPRPEEYFEDPGRHPELAGSQFAGLHHGLARSWAVNRLAFHPDLVDFAERALGSTDLHLYKVEVWAKYQGATNYDQTHHRDFGNHSLVVPKRADPVQQVTTFTLLSDVTDEDGPTRIVPFEHGRDLPYWPLMLPMGDLFDREVTVTGPAGTMFAYRTDILHRGSEITGSRRSRFAVLADFQVWGRRWNGRIAWPHHALGPQWTELVERATPRERALFGFPAPGDPYWDEQTLRDTEARYPGMDMAPYRARSTVGP